MTNFFDVPHEYIAQLNSGYYSQSVDTGITWLREMKKSKPATFSNNPKGTPFYLLGIAAFRSHDFQTAAFLFDAAVSEDIKYYPDNPKTPALLTMQLFDKNINQAALPIVKFTTSKIKKALRSYNKRTGSSNLTVGDVRRHLLSYILEGNEPRLRTMITTFISYFFEWTYRANIIELSDIGSREPFFMHLFRGCVLFESLAIVYLRTVCDCRHKI
jgi:hypothetical protein